MKVLIVFAHPEPRSFGAALLARGCKALRSDGHEVVVSDLYAMGFDPVATARDFKQRRFDHRLQYDREQKYAYAHNAFADDIQAELDKLHWCDLLILQFPLWWFSVPAIMKGWIDRVFVNGLVYGNGRRFDSGGLKGKRAMLSLSTGCYERMAAPDGMLGGLDIILWPLHAGTLAYAGCTVLPPYVAWSVQYADASTQQAYLDRYAHHLTTLDQRDPLYFHPQADFEDYRLRSEIAPRSPGIRRGT
jgi:NAD(P)H dehydrogenase (quinone)